MQCNPMVLNILWMETHFENTTHWKIHSYCGPRDFLEVSNHTLCTHIDTNVEFGILGVHPWNRFTTVNLLLAHPVEEIITLALFKRPITVYYSYVKVLEVFFTMLFASERLLSILKSVALSITDVRSQWFITHKYQGIILLSRTDISFWFIR